MDDRSRHLPPKWDGLSVSWSGFQPKRPVFACTISDSEQDSRTVDPESFCWSCGMNTEKAESLGVISPGRPRLANGAPLFAPAYPRHLTLHRCTRCGHTTVQQGVELFDLEPEDYEEGGSY